MKTLLFASALLLSAAGADGSTGGAPNEPDPNANDAVGIPPQPENLGAPAPDPAVNGGPSTADLTELDEDFARRLAAEREEFDRIRALTPVQELELRPCVGAAHLGLIIGSPGGIRCVSLADWRTDRICLYAGDHAQIVVLAGEGLKTWEFYREQEARANERPALGEVTTASISPAVAAALVGGLAQSAVAAVDPLEETLPADTAPATV